jgi:internalin A
MEAIYSVFDRKKSYELLKRLGGRFRQSTLHDLVWRAFSSEEEKLFLNWMISCGICFVYQKGDPAREIETEYIAPELLPELSDPTVKSSLEERWDDHGPELNQTFEVDYLQPGLVASLIARGGKQFGDRAYYWKEGFYFYDQNTRSRVRVDASLDETPGRYSGRVKLSTRGGDAQQFMARMIKWISAELDEIFRGRTAWRLQETIGSSGLPSMLDFSPFKHRGHSQSRFDIRDPNLGDSEDGQNQAPNLPPDERALLAFQPGYVVENLGYGISYSWKTPTSKQYAERLFTESQKRKFSMIWDTEQNKPFDSYEKFVQELTDPKRRLLVILSKDYLESENCMRELHEVWKQCTWDREQFMNRIRVFLPEDLDILSLSKQLAIQRFWKQEFESSKELIDQLGIEFYPIEQKVRFDRIRSIAQDVGKILVTIADRIFEKDFDRYVELAFEP